MNSGTNPSVFKRRYFQGESILWAVRWYWKRSSFSHSWRANETYVKVNGRWVYILLCLGIMVKEEVSYA